MKSTDKNEIDISSNKAKRDMIGKRDDALLAVKNQIDALRQEISDNPQSFQDDVLESCK